MDRLSSLRGRTMIKEAFRSELYVPREEPLEDLLGWVRQQSPEFRLRSLIGPAGIGKSWFLAHLYRQLNDTNHCLVLWMDLGVEALHPKSGKQLPEIENAHAAVLPMVGTHPAS